MAEEVYRVVGIRRGDRRVWRYRSRPDAIWRARELEASPDSTLIEFSVGRVSWTPAPSGWLQE